MTCQTALPLTPPFECDSPYLSLTPGPIMMVGFCSEGAFKNNGQPSTAGIFQPPSFNVVDYQEGSVHFIPVWMHWTGTCWTGLTTYYVRPQDGKIIFSTGYVPGFVSGNTVNGHLFADMRNVLGMGVGLNMIWNGDYYECGLSITEYTVYGSAAKNRSGLVYPTSYTYHLDYFLDQCNTQAQPTLSYDPVIINPVKAPPLATIQFGPENLIGEQTYPNQYHWFSPAYLTRNPNGFYTQLTGFPTYVQAVGELDETITNLIYAWNGKVDSSTRQLVLDCYDLADLPAEIGYVSFPYLAGQLPPCNNLLVSYFYATGFEYVLVQSVSGLFLPVYFIPPWTPNDAIPNTNPDFLTLLGEIWCGSFTSIASSSLGSATHFAASQGLGPFSVYNKVPMYPDGYNLYVFALGGSNTSAVPGWF